MNYQLMQSSWGRVPAPLEATIRLMCQVADFIKNPRLFLRLRDKRKSDLLVGA